MAVLLALLSSALWGTSDFLGGTATRRLPVSSVLGLSQLAALVVLTPLALRVGADGTSYVLPAVLAGLVGMVALGAFYSALATGTMGIIAPVASLGVLVPVVVGLARGEHPSALQLVGVLAAVGGVVLASGPELSGAAGLRPLLLALLAAVGFGVVVALVAAASRGGGPGRVVLVLVVMRLASLLALTGLLLATRRWQLGVATSDLPLVGVIGLFDVSANAFYALASRGHLLSVVAVLASLYPVVTVLLARRVHAERLRRIQIAGVSTALAGVVLLAAG